ncbi:MAG TPA: hypothetical protein VHH09_00215, partial [Acidimicrobiales bacterium]|nr:hypothetical protein [Acidimicrobiales bacterium]
MVIATPDEAVAEVAAAVDPVATTVVAHLAGSLGLDELAPLADLAPELVPEGWEESATGRVRPVG